MNKLIIIDGNAIMHRAFHALPPLTTKAGEPINAVYGLVSMLLGMIQTFKPTHLTVCFDRKEKTFRKEVFENYQSHRPQMDEGLSSQFQKARDVLSAMQIPVYSLAGFEADDLIGTLSAKATKKISEVVIVTGDKDILQLVNEKVTVFLPTKGVSEGKVYTASDVTEKLGCSPDQVVDYKALVGDSSDNYPGVPGIGPKTATNLLSQYQTFHNIYKHLDKIPETIRKKLVAGRESGELSYTLATIIKNVDFEFDYELMQKWQIDTPELLSVFEEFGFKTLTNRVTNIGKELEKEKQGSLF